MQKYGKYGSIPHLPGSKQGRDDIGLNEGQSKILTAKVRDRHDLVIVQEKLDGACVQILKKREDNGMTTLLPLSRSGILCQHHEFEHLRLFAAYCTLPEVATFINAMLCDGETLCGEWLIAAHGTKYDLFPYQEWFAPFDILDKNRKRLPYMTLLQRARKASAIAKRRLVHWLQNLDANFTTSGNPAWYLSLSDNIDAQFRLPMLLHIGGAYPIQDALEKLALEHHLWKAEGAVWRVERNEEVDFLAKYVRPDYEAGAYFSEKTIYNIQYNDLENLRALFRTLPI